MASAWIQLHDSGSQPGIDFLSLNILACVEAKFRTQQGLTILQMSPILLNAGNKYAQKLNLFPSQH